MSMINTKTVARGKLLQPMQLGLSSKIPGKTFAYPIDSYRAIRKCRKLMKTRGVSYEEAGRIRMNRVGF